MNRFSTLLSNAALCTALAASLVACAVGPDYVASTTELAPLHNSAKLFAQSLRPAPALETWWTGFNDPLLVKIVERALAQNLDLAGSIARVKQARAAASGADANLLPSVDLGASARRDRQSLRSPIGTVAGSSPGFERDVHEVAIGPSASWEIDLFGGNRRGAAAAREEAQAAEADAAGTRVTVVADVADAYLQIRGYQARLAIAQSQVRTDERLLKVVQDRYSAGAAQGREIAQADALVKQARASIPPLRLALERQLNRLDILMGAQPGTYAVELAEVREVPAIPAVPTDDAPRELLRGRPDVIAAERRLAASSERIGVAISGYYPKLSLSAALGFDSVGGGRLFRPDAFQASTGGALRWRLFDFGRVDADIARAKGANEEALAAYRQSVLRAAEDIENSFATLIELQIHTGQVKEFVDALAKSRDLSEQAYRAGTITLTDVLNADQQLLVARDQLDANRADTARAAVSVFRSLGGGWDRPAATVSSR